MGTHHLHVKMTDSGEWIVELEGEREPLSEHPTAGDAEHAARQYAAQHHDDAFVIVHDRYMRLRRSGPFRRTAALTR